MTRSLILLAGVFFALSSHAIDLSIGFKNNYPISEVEIETFIRQTNQVAGSQMYQYEKGSRKVSADGRWLKCVSGVKSCKKDIPLFQGTAGISKVAKPGDIESVRDLDDAKKAPWRQYEVNDPEQAHKLSLAMQKYVYEGWMKQVAQKDKENPSVHFKSNEDRTWCMVPWMNQFTDTGSPARKGRGLIHGLTKEFPIDNSAAYDDIPFKKVVDKKSGEEVNDPNSFSSYGVAYFNRPNCDHLLDIFGDEEKPKDAKLWLDARVEANSDIDKVQSEYETADGSVSFKMLFTTLQAGTAADDEDFDETHATYPVLKDAYKWVAHVSTERGDNRNLPKRLMQKVSHVQMDIAIKDSALPGLMAGQNKMASQADEVIPWVMLTYYFDPNYTNPIFDKKSEIRLSDEEIAKTPEGLKHMRPVGVQFGLDMGQSIIFYEPGKGLQGTPLGVARNNHQPPGGLWTLPEQKEFFATATDHFMDTRLNGPADNPRSSCLGCHASSGVNRFNRYYDKDQFAKIEMTDRIDRSTGKENHPKAGEIHVDLGVLDNDTYNSQAKPNVNVDFNQQIRIALERYLGAD